MPTKKGGPRAKMDADIINKMVAQANTSEETYKVPALPPQREIILGNLVTFTNELAQEDAYRRRKWNVFCVCVLLAIIGIIVALYATGETVFFRENPLRWDFFGIACVFFMPCISWFFWMVCPRTKRCCCCSNVLFLPEYEKRKFLREKREERRTVSKLTRLYHEGDLEAPPEARENEELPYEYDPTQPWLYKRWAPKPPVKVRYDEDGVAWIISQEEEQEAARLEAELLRMQIAREDKEGKDDDSGVAASCDSPDRRKSSVKGGQGMSAKEKYAAAMPK